MEQYLGICMVVVVTGLVIAVLAKLVTGGILEEIDRYRTRRAKRWANIFLDSIKASIDYVPKMLNHVKEAAELDEKYGETAGKYAKKFVKQDVRDDLKQMIENDEKV